MTVVSAMKFNPVEGAIIADEQSSTNRTYNFATKIRTCEGNGVLTIHGGTGAADILYSIDLEFRKIMEDRKDSIKLSANAVGVLGQVVGRVKRDQINGRLQALFGLTETEVQAGVKLIEGKQVPLAPWINEQYGKLISSDTNPYIQNGLLVLAKDAKGIELYTVSMESHTPTPISRPYETIGSGRDTADNELHDFTARIPRDQRDNISPIDGLAALLYSTDRAAMRNLGVGGTPLMKIIRGDEIITPSESETRLATEIVRAQKNELLRANFRNEALSSLLYDKESFAHIEDAMWKEASDKKQLSMLLRGYKRS